MPLGEICEHQETSRIAMAEAQAVAELVTHQAGEIEVIRRKRWSLGAIIEGISAADVDLNSELGEGVAIARLIRNGQTIVALVGDVQGLDVVVASVAGTEREW